MTEIIEKTFKGNDLKKLEEEALEWLTKKIEENYPYFKVGKTESTLDPKTKEFTLVLKCLRKTNPQGPKS